MKQYFTVFFPSCIWESSCNAQYQTFRTEAHTQLTNAYCYSYKCNMHCKIHFFCWVIMGYFWKITHDYSTKINFLRVANCTRSYNNGLQYGADIQRIQQFDTLRDGRYVVKENCTVTSDTLMKHTLNYKTNKSNIKMYIITIFIIWLTSLIHANFKIQTLLTFCEAPLLALSRWQWKMARAPRQCWASSHGC